MPDVLLVTRDPTLKLRLSSAGYDVDDVRPRLLPRRPAYDDVRLAVIDGGDRDAARRLHDVLVAGGFTGRTLFLADDEAGWDGVLDGIEATLVVGRPSTRALRRAVAAALRGDHPPPRSASSRDVPEPVSAAALVRLLDATPSAVEPAADTDAVTRSIERYRELTAGLAPRSAAAPSPADEVPATVITAPTVVEPALPPPSLVPLPLPGTTAGAAAIDHAVTHADDLRLVRAVRALTDHIEVLVTVGEVASAVVRDGIDRAQAVGGAVLVPDGAVWRVAAGVGTRPVETRYELAESHWLIREIAASHKGAIIEDSDGARARLAGVPLSVHRHLIVVSLPDAAGILILARDDEPFDEATLAGLASLASEALPLLRAATGLRDLARLLSDFREER